MSSKRHYSCYLVLRVGDGWWFPLSISFIIPVLRFLSFWIRNVFWLVPVLQKCIHTSYTHTEMRAQNTHTDTHTDTHTHTHTHKQNTTKVTVMILELTSGFVSSGSSILGLSTQSSGFFASGSLIFFGGRKSQSSSKLPL